MPDKINNILAPGLIPDRYQEILYWQLTKKPGQVFLLQFAAIPLLVILGLVFLNLAINLRKAPLRLTIGLSEISLLLAGVVLTLVLHELTHGMAMRLFGAKPRYGFLWKQLMFYATTPAFAYPRNGFLGIALAPLFVLNMVVILGIWLLSGTFWVAVLAVCGAINASGAIGDVWMTIIALRYPASAYVVDERDGIRVFCKL